MNIKPCPMCHTPMAVRRIGTQEKNQRASQDYFIYCRHCGYGPQQTFASMQKAASYWKQMRLGDGKALV